MAPVNVEERLTALEAEVTRMKGQLDKLAGSSTPWWKESPFLNDPKYAKAMRLGKAYRESLRPKPAKKRKRSNGGS